MSSKVAFAVLAACALNASAADLYVSIDDPNAADDSAEGRGSEALPYKSIQAAVDAAETDDTVHVKPGVYTNVTTAVDGWGATRVVLNRRIRLESTGGKDVTAIEGVYDPSSSWGTCDTAVRAVCVGAAAEGSVVKGFTLRNAATRSVRGDVGCGGGLLALAQAYLVDSVVSNCYACESGAALYGGTAIRCLVRGNVNKGESTWAKGTLDHANLWYSVVVQQTINGYGTYLNNTNVNCTYVEWGNRRDTQSVYYNCIKCNYGGKSSDNPGAIADTLQQKDVCFSPVVDGDFEPVAGKADFDIGQTAHIRGVFTVPDEFATTDFAGNEIDYSAASCKVGAIGTESAQVGGGFKVNSGTVVNGVGISTIMTIYSRVWPRVFTVTGDPNVAAEVPGLSRGYNGVIGVPVMDGKTYYQIPPRDVNATVDAWAPRPVILWVSQTRGSDSEGDGTEAAPYATLQKACDQVASASYSLIKVEAGEYEGFELNVAGSYFARVHAVDGPSRTTILGYRAGLREKRCCNFSGAGQLAVQGFTLTGTEWTDTSVDAGVVAGNVILADCLVTNNVSATSLLGTTGKGLRTRFVGNVTGGALATVSSGGYGFCLFAGNTCGSQLLIPQPGGYLLRLYNCTFSGNSVPAGEPMFKKAYFCPNNCVLDANGGLFTKPDRTGLAPSYVWNCELTADSPLNNQVVEADPWLADPANGDYRIVANGPSASAGDWGGEQTDMDYFCNYAQGDVDGNPPEGSADGKMPLGCFQSGLPNGFYVACESGELTLTGANPGVNVIGSETGRMVGISVEPSATRAITGIAVTDASGAVTTNLFADCSQGVWQHTFLPSDSGSGISVLYGTDYYVDAENGSDADNGFTSKTPKKTLAAIAALAVHEGDVIHAAPGTYDAGHQMGPKNTYTYSRVVLQPGVSLVATGDRDATVLAGSEAEFPMDANGNGTNATRCAYLSSDSLLKGFSITHGRAGLWPMPDDDYRGAGVFAADQTARVVDCLFTDCTGSSGSGVAGWRGTYVRCEVRQCKSAFDGVTLISCFLDRCAMAVSGNDNCTVRNSVIIPEGGNKSFNTRGAEVCNTLFYGPTGKGNRYVNCICATNSSYTLWDCDTSADGLLITNVADLAVNYDSRFRPVAGSILIDAGDNAALGPLDEDTKWDLDGAPRVMNGSVDIGMCEWDIRPDVKVALGRRVLSVDWVSSAVVVTDEGVSLSGDGAEVELTANLRGETSLSLAATVSGGVLKGFVDGVLLATLAADGPLDLGAVAPGGRIVLLHEGEGSATAGALRSSGGLILIVR